MSVLFHIAARQDWDRAMRANVYTAASLAGDGFIHCSTATQHAAVANTLDRGRADLVLLLIDPDRLHAAVRFERATPGGEPFPHVYGPVNLDAVFEATPYQPGAGGRFHPHEEASGFAAHGAATLDAARRRALEVMAGFPCRWWVAGGWALDLFLGRKTRPHADLEISVLAIDQASLFAHLRDWDLRLAAPGASLPRWDGAAIAPPSHQVWARKGPGTPASAAEFAADPTMLGFLLEQGDEDRWVFRRHAAITRPLDRVGAAGPDGVPLPPPGDRAAVQGEGDAVQGPTRRRPRPPPPGCARTGMAGLVPGPGPPGPPMARPAMSWRLPQPAAMLAYE